MSTEAFLVTALPHSAAPGRDFHVALFVTHRLTPDGDDKAVVADFPTVARWTEALESSSIQLVGRRASGEIVKIPVTPLLDVLEPSLWPRVFPGDLPVRPWQTPEHTDVPWRTYPAHRMQQHALFVHAASLFSSPVAAPTVADNALTGLLFQALGLGNLLESLGGKLTVDALLGARGKSIDREITDRLDRFSGKGILGRGGGAGSDNQPELLPMMSDIHSAKCYYQREEEQTPYLERPDPTAVAAPVVKPDPDFHERAGMLGDLSPLLRRLGLVIDLRVDDLTTLAGVVSIQAGLDVPDIPATESHPRTACRVLGPAFFATSGSGDWQLGMLKLGDDELFTVLDLDPDASALKLEQYTRTMPRLSATENNGDIVNSAPTSLRATGFALAHRNRAEDLHERLSDATQKEGALLAGRAPDLTLEQISRGLRLEVWDDQTSLWHSLHRRRLDVNVDGAAVLKDVADEGFLQGAALTQADGQPDAPKQAHEVLAGWEGWSLSTPRPGKVIVHDPDAPSEDREQILDVPPVDPDPVNPVASTTRPAPGTLPRLRYGRNYSFRAFAVDLAGNSLPHLLAGVPTDDNDDQDAVASINGVGFDPLEVPSIEFANAKLAGLRLDATTDARQSGLAAEAVRRQLSVLRPPVVSGPVQGRGAQGLDLGGTRITGAPDLDRLIARRLTTADRPPAVGQPTRRQTLESTFTAATLDLPQLLVRTETQTPAPVFGRALATAVTDAGGVGARSINDLLALLGDLITTPRPFLRWDPVIEPATVPRFAHTEGESLLRLVIRTGVTGPADGGTQVTLTPAGDYAAQTVAAHPELGLSWREDSQRHLAPPKTSQFEAELHEKFDEAIGSTDPVLIRAALGAALREAGTFFDTEIADLANPGQTVPQLGVSFHVAPTAEVPEHATPADLPRGVAPTPGQYVAHDVDEMVLPYLPDPLAAGVSLTFPDAGADHRLAGLLAVDGVTLPYAGSWPELTPYRLVLVTGDQLAATVVDNEIRIAVPPGEQLRMRMSSSLLRESLQLLGLWRSLPAVLQNLEILAEAAADGWFWWLTPAVEVRLVHAVPRPVEVPRPTLMITSRLPLDTAVSFFGGVDVHGPSTERIDLEASWTETVDDIAKPGPEQVAGAAAAFGTTVDADEDFVVLTPKDGAFGLPDQRTVRLHGAVHQMGTTKHRTIDYRFRATTRYKEYFLPQVTPTVDDLSVLGPTRRLSIPSTARPPKAIVREVLPLFRWEERTEPEQPFGLRRSRKAGVRIYLDRPWFVSGDGEQLAVLLATGSDAGLLGSVSQWASDPVWAQQGPALRGALPLIDVLELLGIDDDREAGRPVGGLTLRPLVDVAGTPSVAVLGYSPEYSVKRGLWFADIAFSPGTAFWPFVRLAVARYQPDSLDSMHLSAVTLCDFAQLAPERTATLSRPDARHARVVVTGPVGVRTVGVDSRLPYAQQVALSRTMRVRLEKRVDGLDSDLGWTTEAQTDLPVLGVDGTVVSWMGQLDLPTALPPRRPGADPDWRVVVEEWERMSADPGPTGTPRTQSRVVYADHLPL